MSRLIFLLLIGFSLSGCQFQPLYGDSTSLDPNQDASLANIEVAEANTRVGQQVRNHLIFLLNGGTTPRDATREIRLRITSTTSQLASKISDLETRQRGNTAGTVRVSASYEIYDRNESRILARGSRVASASFDQTSQSFASERAERDAENRAARELAEYLRFAIASDTKTS
jgi:LPS-assembly lipoprotein